jgi:hypothetical protein
VNYAELLPDPNNYSGNTYTLWFSVRPTIDVAFMFWKNELDRPLYTQREEYFIKTIDEKTGRPVWKKQGTRFI